MFEKEKRTTFQTAASSCCDLCCPKWVWKTLLALSQSSCESDGQDWILGENGRSGSVFTFPTGYIGCSLGALIEAGGSAWAIGFWGGAQLDLASDSIWGSIQFLFLSVFKFCFSHW